MDIFLLYLFTRLDAIIGTAQFVLVIAGLLCVVAACFAPLLLEMVEDKAVPKKAIKPFFIVVGIAAAVSVLTPTKEDAAFIVAGKVGIKLAQSDEVKETSAKLYQLLQQKLDAALLEEQTDG